MDFLKERLHQTLDNEYHIAKIAKKCALMSRNKEEYEKQSCILSYLSFLHYAIDNPIYFDCITNKKEEEKI